VGAQTLDLFCNHPAADRLRVSHVTLAVNHQFEIIRTYFGDGGRWNIKTDWSRKSRSAPRRRCA
jgi:hypothetical protein